MLQQHSVLQMLLQTRRNTKSDHTKNSGSPEGSGTVMKEKKNNCGKRKSTSLALLRVMAKATADFKD